MCVFGAHAKYFFGRVSNIEQHNKDAPNTNDWRDIQHHVLVGVHCAGLRQRVQCHAPLICKKYERYRLVQMPSRKQSYPLREELATILTSEWSPSPQGILQRDHGGLVLVVDSLNHQLERIVGVIQDALVDAQWQDPHNKCCMCSS